MTARIRPWRVYVAGPMTNGDTAANISRGMKVAADLIMAGFAVYCPHLDWFLQVANPQIPHTYETWLPQDEAWLVVSDVIVRIPGESPGSDREVDRAVELGIPVVRLNSLSPIEDQIAEVLR